MVDKMKCKWQVTLDITQSCSRRASATHISEFALYDCDGKEIPPIAGTISNPGGKSKEKELPKYAFDKDVTTKWFDPQEQGGHQLIFSIAQPLASIASYSWTSANNWNYRDPKRWTLEGREINGLNDAFVLDAQYKDADYTCTGSSPPRPRRFNKNTFVTENFNKCPAKQTATTACPPTGCAGCHQREGPAAARAPRSASRAKFAQRPAGFPRWPDRGVVAVRRTASTPSCPRRHHVRQAKWST